jgi:hypothetical protein
MIAQNRILELQARIEAAKHRLQEKMGSSTGSTLTSLRKRIKVLVGSLAKEQEELNGRNRANGR